MPVPSFSQQRINKVAAFQSILAAEYCTAVMACQLRFTYIERFGEGEGGFPCNHCTGNRHSLSL